MMMQSNDAVHTGEIVHSVQNLSWPALQTHQDNLAGIKVLILNRTNINMVLKREAIVEFFFLLHYTEGIQRISYDNP